MKALTLVIIFTGIVSQYGPSRMESNLAVRQAGHTAYTPPHDLSSYHGFIAVNSCADIGKLYYVRPLNCPDCRWERFLAVDCSGHEETTWWMNINDIFGEIGYASVERFSDYLDKDMTDRGIPVEIAVETKRWRFE